MMLMLLTRKDQLLFTSVAGECTYTCSTDLSVSDVSVCMWKLHPCAVFCRHGFNGVCKKTYLLFMDVLFFLHVSVCECMNVCVCVCGQGACIRVSVC